MTRILIVGPSWVGDMVMANSLFRVLSEHQPQARISVLAPSWSEPVLARMPEVSESVCMPVGHGSLGLGARYRLGRELREREFSQAIVIPGSLKSALVPWFARIPVRTGYLGEQRRGLLNDIRPLDKAVLPLNVQRYVALALPRSTAAPPALPYPKLRVSDEGVDSARNRLGLTDTRPVLGICPGAEYGPAKRWPVAHFASVAGDMLDRGWQVWLFGSGNDAKISAEINARCAGRCDDLAGRTDLGEAIDLMSQCRAVVSNDSGLMHVAAAVGCHVIALFGSSSDEFTPPLTERCDRLGLELDCRPCFKRECPLGHLDCLNRLAPEMVAEALDRVS